MTDDLPETLTSYTLLDIDQVAGLVGVSVKTIRLWMQRGAFPAPVRPGGKLMRWPVERIRKWVDQDCSGGWCHPDDKLL